MALGPIRFEPTQLLRTVNTMRGAHDSDPVGFVAEEDEAKPETERGTSQHPPFHPPASTPPGSPSPSARGAVASAGASSGAAPSAPSALQPTRCHVSQSMSQSVFLALARPLDTGSFQHPV